MSDIFTIQIRRGPAATWTSINPILHDGEPGFEDDTGLLKFGNGVDPWTDLDYSGSISDPAVAAIIDSGTLTDVAILAKIADRISDPTFTEFDEAIAAWAAVTGSATREALAGKTNTITVGRSHNYDFNCLDYASDDLAFQAAVDSIPAGFQGGMEVVAASGVFDFVNPVDATAKSNVHFTGAGLATIIRWKNGNTFATATANTNWLLNLGDHCTVNLMQLRGQSTFTCPLNGVNTQPAGGTNTLGGGIRWTGGRVFLDHLYITGFAEDGLTNQGGIGTKYGSLMLIACGGQGLNVTSVAGGGGNFATDGDLSSVWIGSCGGGISVNAGGTWISGAHVWGCQGDGIVVNADAVRIHGCYPESNAGWGINIINRNNCVVTGCDIFANGLGGNQKGGLTIAGGKFNQIIGNQFRDNRYHNILANGVALDNTIEANTGTDSVGYDITNDTLRADLTAAGTQTLTTTFTDNNAPAWMANANTAIGLTLVIAGAGAGGAALTTQVTGWTSTTQVTLAVAMSTAAVNPTYRVCTVFYGFREAGTATRNLVKDNNFRQCQSTIISLRVPATGRMSRSVDNKGMDEASWVEGGNVSSGAISLDLRQGAMYHATLTADVTALAFFSAGVIKGTEYVVSLTQDGTGGRSVSGWPASFIFADGVAPAINPDPNSTTFLRFRNDGTNWIEQSRSFSGTIRKVLAADAPFTNSTLANLLGITLSPNSQWIIRGVIVFDGGQTGDLKVRVEATGATGASGYFGLGSMPAASTTSTTAASIMPADAAAIAVSAGNTLPCGALGAGVFQMLSLGGVANISAVGGTLNLQAAQQTTDATPTTVRAGTWIEATRVA